LITLVLDASVAVKWAIPAATEPLAAESLRLLKCHSNGEIEFIVPDVFWAEVGNVMWKGSQRARWSRSDAERAVRDMQARDFVTVPSQRLLSEALDIAFAYDRGVYDCLYAALAFECRADLVTADERLVNSLAARFPVRWLGVF
jgi:predicted nucleic acid-binding protein